MHLRIPYNLPIAIGKDFNLVAFLINKRLAISSIRIKKFCSNSHFGTSVPMTGFQPSVTLEEGLKRIICYEFIERQGGSIFFTE